MDIADIALLHTCHCSEAVQVPEGSSGLKKQGSVRHGQGGSVAPMNVRWLDVEAESAEVWLKYTGGNWPIA